MPRLGRRTARTLPLLPPPQKNRSPPSDSSPETPVPAGISRRSSTSPRLGIDAPHVALVALPGAVPELAVDPGDAGDEAIGLDGAEHGSGLGIDLVDPAVAMLADPERPFGPGEPRSPRRCRAPGSWRAPRRSPGRSSGSRSSAIWNRCLPSNAVPASPATSSAPTISPLSGSRAFSLSPEANQTCWPSKRDPVHAVDARKGAVFAEDLGGRCVLHAAHPSRSAAGRE